MNRLIAKPLEFKEYQVGDRFYLKQIPPQKYSHYSDPKRTQSKISPKLQHRYVGPYTITNKFSPVLYEAEVNGEYKTIHALKMKPAISKHYTQHITEIKETTPLGPPTFIVRTTDNHIPIRTPERRNHTTTPNNLNLTDNEQEIDEQYDNEEED